MGMKEEMCSFLCGSCNYALFGPYYLALEEQRAAEVTASMYILC